MLKLVYPKDQHETYEASTFLIGSINPEYRLFIQQTPVYLSPSGFFSHPVELTIGSNTILLEIQDKLVPHIKTQKLVLHRLAPMAALPEFPLSLALETVAPQSNWCLVAGQTFSIAFLASPGSIAYLHIPGILEEPVLLNTQTGEGVIENRQAIFAQLHQVQAPIPCDGYTSGTIQIPESAGPCKDQAVEVHLTNETGETNCITLLNTLTIWAQAKTGTVQTHQAITRLSPGNGSRWTPQPTQTQVSLISKIGSWYQVALRSGQSIWMQEDDVIVQDSTPLPPAALSILEVTASKLNELQLFFPTASRRPLQIESSHDTLKIRLYQVDCQLDFIRLPVVNFSLPEISWRPVSDGVIEIKVEANRIGGYNYLYTDEGLQIDVTHGFKTIEETIILIDPGHGGDEMGSTAPSGTPEKDLNLSLSLKLATALKNSGFEVYLTRTADQTVSLAERSQHAIDVKADIVLSIHHNALPDGRNPQQERGLSTYYYHNHAKPLAQAIQATLPAAIGLPDYGLLYDSLHMTRIPQAISLLLEVGFLTHPDDAEKVLNPHFQSAWIQVLKKILITQ